MVPLLIEMALEAQGWEKPPSLVEAVQFGKLDSVKGMISSGIQVEPMVLHVAAQFGHLDIIKYLVSLGSDITTWDSRAVKLAAMNGHLEVVKYLISIGEDVITNNGAVELAIYEGNLEVVRYLISVGADYRGCEYRLESILDVDSLPDTVDEVLSVIDMVLVERE